MLLMARSHFTTTREPQRSFLQVASELHLSEGIVLQAAHDNLPHKIFLFYSNRRPEYAAFLHELMEIQEKSPNYIFLGTMTEMEKSDRKWDGETGYINKALLEKMLVI